MGALDLIREPNIERLRVALEAAADQVTPLANRLGAVPEFLKLLTDDIGFDVTIGGRTCMIVSGRAMGDEGGGGRFLGMNVIIKIEAIPISLSVNGRAKLSPGTPELGIADPAFSSAFRVYGFPEDLAAEILDAETRNLCLAGFETVGKLDRRQMHWLSAGHGKVTRFAPIPGSGLFVRRIEPDPRELRQQILATFAIADRLTNGWARRYADVVARQGPVAAAAWQNTKQSETAGFVQAKRRSTLIVVGILLAVALLLACGITAAIVGVTMRQGEVNDKPLIRAKKGR